MRRGRGRRLEDEPILNAGTGSYLQADGVARLDASLMASDGRAGAVAQVPGLKNPVRLARYLLEQDAHVMLFLGQEALQLALRLGHPAAVVATPAKIAYWQENLRDPYLRLTTRRWAPTGRPTTRGVGTVGCVCARSRGPAGGGDIDGRHGQCYPGRVGDTPILGAGTYCTPHVGVSMTGVGERIMILLSSKRLADLRRRGGMPRAGAAARAASRPGHGRAPG